MEKYPPFISKLSPDLLEKARTELNENPETRDEEIHTLRKRLQQCPGLDARLDSSFLVRFLRARKFDQDRALKLVTSYYQIRKDNPDMFTSMLPSSVTCVMDAEVTGVLDARDKLGRRVLVVRPGRWDPTKCPLTDIFKLNFMSLSKLIEEEETQVNGVILMVELSDLGWVHAKSISPFYAKRMSTLLQEAFPARFKSIHYINEPSFFDYVFLIIKQFLKEKIVKRINFHGDRLKELQEVVDVENLPEDFGGNGPKWSTQKWKEYLLSCEEEFKEDLKYGFSNVQPVAATKEKEDAIPDNVTGTFRKLDIN